MDPQAKARELMESARRTQTIGEWAALIGLAFVLITLLVGAFFIHRKGLKISEGYTLKGRGATILAVGLALASIGLAVWGAIFIKGLFR